MGHGGLLALPLARRPAQPLANFDIGRHCFELRHLFGSLITFSEVLKGLTKS